MANRKWLAFFAAIKHEHTESVLECLKKYDIGQFIIAKEKAGAAHSETEGEHLHFCVEMPPEQYVNFSKCCFIDKYKLRGRAPAGQSRQYGKVKEIRNLQKMQAYTLKDGDYITNMDEEVIKELYKQSAKKVEKKNIYDICMENMKTVEKPGRFRPNCSYMADLKYEILRTHIKEDVRKDVSKLIMERYIRMFMMYHSDFSEDEKIRMLYDIFFLG